MLEPGTVIGVLGGTGALGSGLARRWARAGHPVVIGTRNAEKAAPLVAEIASQAPSVRVEATDYVTAAREADIAVLTVPFANQEEILKSCAPVLAGKLVVDCTVPLRPPKVATVQLPPEGSAAQRAKIILGEDITVTSAFHNVSAQLLADPAHDVDCDVLVFGPKDDRPTVVALVEAAGLTGLEAGPLANSAAAEALTSVLIQMNRRFKGHSGLRITGLAPAGEPPG